ncbi:hypothetical protein WMY93_028074 [Mugilogobius chulae]|uniref:Uncharacterized protein n=1 Tax=Mugilogobius chulae TaxID=88201 RepID=A0AAW0MYA2_9GOBI
MTADKQSKHAFHNSKNHLIWRRRCLGGAGIKEKSKVVPRACPWKSEGSPSGAQLLGAPDGLLTELMIQAKYLQVLSLPLHFQASWSSSCPAECEEIGHRGSATSWRHVIRSRLLLIGDVSAVEWEMTQEPSCSHRPRPSIPFRYNQHTQERHQFIFTLRDISSQQV